MKKLSIILAILAMIGLTGFPYYSYGDVIYGCYQKNNGQLRVLIDNSECRPSEMPISLTGQIGPRTVDVDCDKGETIANALQQLGNPLTIQVKGTCNENVDIRRDNVILIADPPLSGTVDGLDPNNHTINVRTSGVVINGLKVTGGWHGINVTGSVTIRNSIIENTGRNGISFFRIGRGTVDNCWVQNNGRHGITIEGNHVTVIYSWISLNTGMGIVVQNGAGARIGFNDSGQYAGNEIRSNGSNGIQVFGGGSAFIGGNTITENGTNEGSLWGRYGVAIYDATADLIGGNSITGNAGSGIFARSSRVKIGDPGFTDLPTYGNIISGNGTGISTTIAKGGIYGYLGTSLDIRYATINNNTGSGINGYLGTSLDIRYTTINDNTGDGVILRLRSTARMRENTVVNGNSGNGILLDQGGGLRLDGLPYTPVTVTGNTGFGLQCYGDESSYFGDVSGITANPGGDVSENCTGF